MTADSFGQSTVVAACSAEVMRMVPAGLSRSSLIAATSASMSSNRGATLLNRRSPAAVGALLRVVRVAPVDPHSWRAGLDIRVEDDGPGIPPAERENVFKPFYRIDHARNQDQGNSGLGLAIARDIVRGHGGTIDLEQSALGGLLVSVKLPL